MGDKLYFYKIDILKLLSDSRKRLNITLRDLSEKTNYSYQNLSKYEIGLRDLNHENLRTISRFLEIDLDSVFYIENHLDRDLDDLLESLIFDYPKETERLITQVRQAQSYIDYSYHRNRYHLLFHILHILGFYGDLSSYDYVEKNVHLFDNYLKQLYYDYKAIEVFKKNQIIEAVKFIDLALQYESSENSAGMIHYHASLIYTFYGKLNKALSFIQIAEGYFFKTRNLNRLTQSQVHSASINAKLGQYRTSKKMYHRILSTTLNSDLNMVILYNLAWFSYLNKQYDDSLTYLSQLEKSQTLTENGIYIKCSCLYQLGRVQEADELFQNTISTFKDPMYKLEMEIIQSEHTCQSPDIESKLLELYTLTKDSRNFENYEFVLDRLISYYEYKSKYKKAISYYKDKFTLMNWMYSN